MADQILKDRLNLAMERRRLTAAEASRRAGLSPTAVRDILQDRVDSPRFDTLQKLCGVLGVNVDWLTGAGSDEIGDAAAVGYNERQFRAAIESVLEGLAQRGMTLTPAETATFIVYTYEELTRAAPGDSGAAARLADNVIRFEAVKRR